MWHPIKHYKTIRHHKMLVMKNCFRCGLYWQGLTHDLSKLAPVEFWAGAKYWQGTCSPNNAQRQAEGYSAAWLHHKGRPYTGIQRRKICFTLYSFGYFSRRENKYHREWRSFGSYSVQRRSRKFSRKRTRSHPMPLHFKKSSPDFTHTPNSRCGL